MTTRYLAAGALAAALFAVPGLAQAQVQTAVTARTVNLRAGPAADYPAVAVLPAGFAIAVQGCLPDYTWCDVIAGYSRGWMYAGNIDYYYQDRYVPVLNYGPAIGIGALAFVLNDYWGSHYRERRWYGERHRWIDRHGPRYEPVPGWPAQRPGWDRPRVERHAPAGSPPVARAERRRRGVEAQSGSSQPNPPITRQEQHQLNQGGSSSVDPSLRPSY